MLRREVAVYRASGQRGNTADAEIAYLQKLVAETGAKAIKFRLGARMRYDDASTEWLGVALTTGIVFAPLPLTL